MFNLGATMYWVLTEMPYPTAIRQPTRRGGIDLVTQETLRTPHEINELIPGPLSRLVMDCCQENPRERPPDMKAMMSRLETVQSLWNKRRRAAVAKQRADADAPAPGTEGGATPTAIQPDTLDVTEGTTDND